MSDNSNAVSIEEVNEVEKIISINIPGKDYKTNFSSELNRIAKRASLKGFRPGKAPISVVSKLYGESIKAEVVNKLVTKAYQEVLDKNKLNIVGQPKLDVDFENEEDGLKVRAEVAIFPNPEIKHYKDLSLEVEVVTEKKLESMIEDRFKDLPRELSRPEKIEDREEVQDADILVLNLEAFDGEDKIDSLSFKNAFVELGQKFGQVPEFIHPKLVGLKKSVEVEFKEAVPADFSVEDLRGKKLTFKALVESIYVRDIKELTDEYVKERGVAESVEELKKRVRSQVQNEVKSSNLNAKEQKLVDVISEKNEFLIPQAMIDEEIREMLFQYGVLDPKKRESYSFDVSQFRESSGEMASKRAKSGIVVRKIIEQEKIKVDDADIEAWLEEKAKEEGIELEEFKNMFAKHANKGQLKSAILREKIIDFLVQNNKIKEIEAKQK